VAIVDLEIDTISGSALGVRTTRTLTEFVVVGRVGDEGGPGSGPPSKPTGVK
jgi:hypothetical protein